MMDTLAESAEPLTESRLQIIDQRIAQSLRPVRPLPSDRVLLSVGLLLFIGFCLLATYFVGFFGARKLGFSQSITYYSALIGLAFLFSLALVQDMIPGSKKLLQSWPLIVLLLAVIVALPFALFHDISLARFVPLGIPCLRLGCVCALASGILIGLGMKNGFVVSPLRVSLAAGFLGGLTGFSVLALHCPILNAVHVVVWHGGAVLAGGLVGAIAGLIRERIS